MAQLRGDAGERQVKDARIGVRDFLEQFPCLLGLFFMTVGAGIDFDLLFGSFGTILGLTFGLMLVKAAVLFALVGVPQSHISKIENGAVDLKLSSLVQIARALDLELKLIPRKAIPAVEGIVRATKGFPRDRTSQALSEIKNLERSLSGVSASSLDLSLPLKHIDNEIALMRR